MSNFRVKATGDEGCYVQFQSRDKPVQDGYYNFLHTDNKQSTASFRITAILLAKH
jgi:hypothetical protein